MRRGPLRWRCRRRRARPAAGGRFRRNGVPRRRRGRAAGWFRAAPPGGLARGGAPRRPRVRARPSVRRRGAHRGVGALLGPALSRIPARLLRAGVRRRRHVRLRWGNRCARIPLPRPHPDLCLHRWWSGCPQPWFRIRPGALLRLLRHPGRPPPSGRRPRPSRCGRPRSSRPRQGCLDALKAFMPRGQRRERWGEVSPPIRGGERGGAVLFDNRRVTFEGLDPVPPWRKEGGRQEIRRGQGGGICRFDKTNGLPGWGDVVGCTQEAGKGSEERS